MQFCFILHFARHSVYIDLCSLTCSCNVFLYCFSFLFYDIWCVIFSTAKGVQQDGRVSSFWKPAFVFDYVCTEILPLILAKKNILLLLLFLSWLKFYSLTIITLCGVSFAAYRERCCRCTRIFRFRICLSRKTDSVRDWASFWTCWLPYRPQIAESASSPVAPYTIPAPQECESPIELTYHLQQPTRRTSTIAQEKFVSETEIFSQNFSENEMLPVEQNGRILRWFTVYLC